MDAKKYSEKVLLEVSEVKMVHNDLYSPVKFKIFLHIWRTPKKSVMNTFLSGELLKHPNMSHIYITKYIYASPQYSHVLTNYMYESLQHPHTIHEVYIRVTNYA